MIVSRPRVGRDRLAFPAPTSGIQRVDMMKILGVTLTYTLSFNTHIDIVLRQAAPVIVCAQSTSFARSHWGSPLGRHTRNHTVQNAIYASPAWWGYVDMGYRQRLQNFIFKLQRLGFLPNNTPHSKKCVVPRMTSFLDQCLLMNTMYTGTTPSPGQRNSLSSPSAGSQSISTCHRQYNA